MAVLVEEELLQFKPGKKKALHSNLCFVEVFSLHFWDHDFKDREAKQETSDRTLEVDFELGTKHLACK